MMRRFLCLIGIHTRWVEAFRAEPDILGIATVIERCACGHANRKVWDFGDGTRRVI